ncbi:MAG: FliM/FliN family flagellar motor C-terminal domain-containing protein [Planctomycetales bacterium]
MQSPNLHPDPRTTKIRAAREDFTHSLQEFLARTATGRARLEFLGTEQVVASESFHFENPSRAPRLLQGPSGTGIWLVDWNDLALRWLVQEMLGGGCSEPASDSLEVMTEIERSLADAAIEFCVRALEQAWESCDSPRLEELRQPARRRLCSALAQQQQLVCWKFQMVSGARREPISIGIPRDFLHQHGLLGNPAACDSSAREDGSDSRSDDDESSVQRHGELIARRIRMPRLKLLNLRVGDLLTTDASTDQPMELHLDGFAPFLARPVAYQGARAALLLEPISPPAPE